MGIGSEELGRALTRRDRKLDLTLHRDKIYQLLSFRDLRTSKVR